MNRSLYILVPYTCIYLATYFRNTFQNLTELPLLQYLLELLQSFYCLMDRSLSLHHLQYFHKFVELYLYFWDDPFPILTKTLVTFPIAFLKHLEIQLLSLLLAKHHWQLEQQQQQQQQQLNHHQLESMAQQEKEL